MLGAEKKVFLKDIARIEEFDQFVIAADGLAIDKDLGDGLAAGHFDELVARRVVGDVYLLEFNLFGLKELFGCRAVRAISGRVDRDLFHFFFLRPVAS